MLATSDMSLNVDHSKQNILESKEEISGNKGNPQQKEVVHTVVLIVVYIYIMFRCTRYYVIRVRIVLLFHRINH